MRSTPERVRLLLVDDHAIVRMGLAALFGTVPEFRVVGEAASAGEAVLQARRHQPDVVLLDVRLPDESGIAACRQIRAELPDTRVIMLTTYAEDDSVINSVLAGASAYLLKQSDPERLIEAVWAVARGESLLDPGVTRSVLTWLRRVGSAPQPDDPLAALSEQERRILPLIAEGKTNREIAAALFLSEHTVKTYVSDLLKRLRLHRRAEAAAFIARHRSSSAS
jgi:two-component system, NarL family, response regulator DevR